MLRGWMMGDVHDFGEKGRPAQTLECVKTYYRVERRQISFLRFIFEAYDGIAVVTTMDAAKGVVVILIAPGCERVVSRVLKDLAGEMLIERIDGT